uniref:Uncharacterized protein n=1 Tax=Cucumis melo TaxID=3656 RepID=A0A9I9EFT1_CUCME
MVVTISQNLSCLQVACLLHFKYKPKRLNTYKKNDQYKSKCSSILHILLLMEDGCFPRLGAITKQMIAIEEMVASEYN